MRAREIQRIMRTEANATKAAVLGRFFKTGPGEYGAGDKFLGLTVPQTRIAAKKFCALPFSEIATLLRSPYHEERLAALLILVHNFEQATPAERRVIFEFYLKNTAHINNWDLVDLSAPNIIGEYLTTRPHKGTLILLKKLAQSSLLWKRRIAMLATFAFIKRGSTREAFEIADILLQDSHDLMHKAVGWMLREAGKRVSLDAEEEFLRTRYQKMPRTMLRYAIERFPKKRYAAYLAGRV